MLERAWWAVWCVVLVGQSASAANAEFPQSTVTVSVGGYRVEVSEASASRYDARNLLGTHSLWWGQQADLWIAGKAANHPVVDSFFRNTGGVIRYGGGANEISWTACTGPAANRPAVKAVEWAGPMKCAFGVPEYLATLRGTGGTDAWLIANIVGIDHRLFGPTDLIDEVGSAASALRRDAADLKRFWELGNELERGRYRWSAETIAARSSAAGREILRRDAQAHLVLPLIEYDDPNQPPRNVFNESLLRAMTQPVDGVALHLYYDGQPGGPSMPTQFRTVTETSALYRRVMGRPGALWITEHGRWPEGDGRMKDWKANWYKTNDMDGVLATADFLIGLSQIDDVAGAMLHGLRAGPWNVFDKTPDGPTPSGVGRLLLLFSEVAPSTRLRTRSFSQNQSRYKGGYDMRAAAFRTLDQRSIAAWLVNRAPVPVAVSLALPASASPSEPVQGGSLLCPEPEGRCTGNQFQLVPVTKEQVVRAPNGLTITLPARSVTSLSLAVKR